jgi:hypothetical protein
MIAFCLRIVLLTATALAYSSCAAPVVQRQAAFNEADFASTRGTGAASVVGQAFTVLESNSVRYGKNVLVDLAAVTPYTTEIVERKLQHGQNLAPGDPRFDQFRRSQHYAMGYGLWGTMRVIAFLWVLAKQIAHSPFRFLSASSRYFCLSALCCFAVIIARNGAGKDALFEV